MADPGGERQDPRVKVWVLLDQAGVAVGAALDVDTARVFRESIPEACGWRKFYVPASSVPVGGAPRDDQIAETVRLDPDRVRDVLDASRDEQNDEGYALPNGRGVRWVCDTCGAHTTMARRQSDNP